MNSDAIRLKIADGIYDIYPPVDPGLSTIETGIISIIVIIAVSAIVYIIWSQLYSVKGQARRNIKKLHNNYSENKVTDHDAIYQLCQLLCQGIKTNHIGINTPLPEKLALNKTEWLEFVSTLSVVRYGNNDDLPVTIDSLFKDSIRWLKLWP